MNVYRRKMAHSIKLAVAITLLAVTSASGQPTREIDWNRYQEMAVKLMQEYLRVNTSNPPGNEIAAAKFFKTIFDQHGIPNETFEYKPGRVNIIARLKGSGTKRPIILLNHMDVVTADPAAWEVDPFSGEIRLGSIYGRGALDMKGEALIQLMAMIILKTEGPQYPAMSSSWLQPMKKCMMKARFG